MKTRAATELMPSMNQRGGNAKPPSIPDVEVVAFHVMQHSPNWVLVDRTKVNRKPKVKGQPRKREGESSATYIWLRRRGFEVAIRHLEGVKNYWARWTYPVPEFPELPDFDGDKGLISFGEETSTSVPF